MSFILILWLVSYLVVGLISTYFTLTVPKDKVTDESSKFFKFVYWHGVFFAVLFVSVALITLVVELYDFIRPIT